jgi:type IV pilus assembly protein PilB
MARRKLGEMLIEAGVLSDAALKSALAEQRKWGGSLGKMVVEMKLCTEEALVDVLSKQLVMDKVDLDGIVIEPHVLELVPAELVIQYQVVPFGQPMKFLDIAMSDPTNLGIIDELRIRTQLNIRGYLAGPKMIERTIAKYYGHGVGVTQRIPRMHSGLIPRTRTGDLARSQSTEIPRITDSDLSKAAELAALQARVSQLEANVSRDEEVLRKLLALLVEKGIATRDEVLERIK